MKLIYRITLRISLVLLLLMTAWAFFFYTIIVDEINDETDDSLEDYSEMIIMRALAGDELPSNDNGSNNTYYITEVGDHYKTINPGLRYSDEMVYVRSKKETEPARILRTIFRNADDQFYELTVMIPTIEKEDLQETILKWIVLLYIALLLAIIGVNVWVLRKSLKPLYVLLDWLERFTVGKSYQPLKNHTNVSEFRKLNEAIIRTASRNEEMYEQQKQFIGNASHEMQTPLAVCQNRLEVLMNSPELTEGELSEIVKTRQTLDYIVRLNKTLLLLSKIDNRQFPEAKTVSITEVIDHHQADYAEVYAHRRIEFVREYSAHPEVQMNEMLATILFNNLLKNAYVHTPEGGRITVRVTPKQLVIRNTAAGEALDGDRIFERFYQARKKEGSTGLGLSLVKSVAKFYDMPIHYHFEEGEHVFTVQLSV